MAASQDRRPGFSRKAQYGLFATYVLAIAGALFAALLLIISIADPAGFSALRTTGSEITAPPARFFNSIRRSLNDMGGNMSAYFDAASKNAALTKEVEASRIKLIEAQSVALENERLKKMLALYDSEPQRVAIGYLISSTASSSRRLATLSVGSNSGVAKGQPVRGPEGLIGRILEVGPNTARVLLISDADNVVPVMRVSDGLPAFATGLANGMVSIKSINLGVNPFNKGDVIVTSGNGGLYQPNIPYAIVRNKSNDGAVARPLAIPGRTPFVIVLPIYQPAATAALESITPQEQSQERPE
jgi:rod shape-determining protein MreC